VDGIGSESSSISSYGISGVVLDVQVLFHEKMMA